jgi:hypothetical protein
MSLYLKENNQQLFTFFFKLYKPFHFLFLLSFSNETDFELGKSFMEHTFISLHFGDQVPIFLK